jgi:hypothetical protein
MTLSQERFCWPGKTNRGGKERNSSLLPAVFLWEVYKPGFVFVWSSLYEAGCPAPLATYPEDQRAASSPPVRSCSRWGLPGRHVSMPPVRSYRTISPLPPGFCVVVAAGRLYHFCGTFRRVTPPGRYPASCPMEPGLSSPVRCPTGKPAESLAAATTRPPAAHSTSVPVRRQIRPLVCSAVRRRASRHERQVSSSHRSAAGLPCSIATAIDTVCCWRIN